MATYTELISYLKGKGYDFNIETEWVGPTDEFTEEEQEEQCCGPVDVDECADDGKVEPWSGWSDEERESFGSAPELTPEVLLRRAEKIVGKGNVHLETKIVGPPGNCGTKETEWTDEFGCCENPNELLKGTGYTSVERDHDYHYTISPSSGELPATWHVLGVGLTIAGRNTSADLHVDDCFCKPGVVYAQDTCMSIAPWVVSAADGSWSAIADTELSSPFGWFQDGTSGHFYVLGFNDDYTQVSTQYYTQAEGYAGTKEVVCGTSFPGLNESPIVTPQDSHGFEKCESNNVWVKLKEGFTNIYDVRYAIDSQGTSEYTEGVCEEELVYDKNNSAGVIADDSNGLIKWTGGKSPFLVSVSGTNFFTNEQRSEVQTSVAGNQLYIYTGDACGTCIVTITDKCGSSVEEIIRATDGTWVGYCAVISWNQTGTSNPFGCRSMYSQLPYYNTHYTTRMCIYTGNGVQYYKPGYVGTWCVHTWNGGTPGVWRNSCEYLNAWCQGDGQSGAGQPLWGIDSLISFAEAAGGEVILGTNDINGVYPYGPGDTTSDNSCFDCHFNC